MDIQFEYSGIDRSGQPVKGIAEGESPMPIVLRLREEGVRVYSIRKKLASERRPPKTRGKIKASDLIAFNAQLSSLLKTKIPLTDSLRHLSKELKNPRFKAVLEKFTDRIESGGNFSESLAQCGDFFPPLYVSMVEAGEKSGNIAEVLLQASQYFQSIADFRRKFLYVLFYPAALTILATGVLVFLLKLMVPPYVEMYSGFHVDFPFSLRLLVQMEEFLSLNLFWKILAPAGLVALIAVVLAVRRSEPARAYFSRLVLRIPFWGRMLRELVLARSFETLAVLLRSGVPLHESLNIIKNMVSNRPLREAFELGADGVLEGQLFSQVLVKQSLFPLEVAWIVRSGEARGDLVGSLEKAKQICRNKFEFSSKILLSVLEPALLVAIGAAVVSIAVSLFYPLYSISKFLGD